MIVLKTINCFYLWILIYFLSFPTSNTAIFFDWLWTSSKETLVRSNGPFPSIPFEYKSEDEKFIEEASKYTDLMKSSSLDLCHHKVILQIKTSCYSMTEEELSKMSVNLLNCQSEVDGRKVFPCTETMTLKECTKDMDANMWNAYHLMNNRARAVCLAARRTQFHALSEMTVNKLMATAHDQMIKMTNLLEGQEKLETLTLGTLNSIEKGNEELINQQNALSTAQKRIQDFVSSNLEQLTTEKALIAAGNKELAKMTELIREKLDEANHQLIHQSKERALNHAEILKDIEALQMQAHDIFQRVGSGTDQLLAQHELASKNYNAVIENLLKINDTVHYLLTIINVTRNEIDERFYWIQDFLDGRGNHIERLLSVTFHVIYLLVGMLFASFLNFSNTSRALLALVVPLNLVVTYKRGPDVALNFSQITIFLISGVVGLFIFHKVHHVFSSPRHQKIEDNTFETIKKSQMIKEQPENNSKDLPIMKFSNVFGKLVNRLNKLFSFIFGWAKKGKINGSSNFSSTQMDDNFISSSFLDEKNESLKTWNDYTPFRDKYSQSAHSRVNEWLQSKVDYPRQGSPSSTTSGSLKLNCSAVCRSGRRCKNTTYPGRDVCHRHLTGIAMEN